MKLRFFFGVCILIFLLNGCTASPAGNGNNDAISLYRPPASPGLVTEKDRLISIQPEKDTTYITNPGIGWQDGPEPFGFMYLTETVAYSNRREIGWSALNPEMGNFEWSPLDDQLNEAVRFGKQFSFRVYTYVGEDYDGHLIPSWVLDSGALLLPSGEPDYSNCVYQEQWGKFVDELRRVYDGNPNIAFIDISGYGNFSEWSWRDEQTEWDSLWEDDYANGVASADSFETLDGQARRRLADMFIGGSIQGHSCRLANGDIVQVDYSYRGFQETQLVMPYAGIVQSTQYVFTRRKDVGFRFDCLGRDGEWIYQKVENELSQVWQKAPVVFELCKPDEVDIDDARFLLQAGHGSIVHNNKWEYSYEQLVDMMVDVGYRYFLKYASLKAEDRQITLQMDWQNTGLAPSYPKMGQDLSLHFYLVNAMGEPVLDRPMPVDISTWMPSTSSIDDSQIYSISETISLPVFLQNGDYYAGVSILDLRTGKPINLAFGEPDSNGINILFPVTIK